MLSALSKSDLRQLLKRSLFTAALLIALIGIGLIINAASAKRAAGGFELARDFPRGALVYAQFKDLPAMLKQWDESDLKRRYLESTSFQQLQSRHLALKLVSRWKEFSDATGFPIDTAVLNGVADNRAAIAVYDIGRLDLVLIAPLSEEKLAASLFFQGKGNFEEVELPDGTAYYLHDVEADRGRQKQQIGFASVNGRFLLATNEKLLLRAIANLNGQAKKDRLTDEPAFQALSKVVAPHLVTVWVDQSKLNEDWYFKHYWIMRNVADLKKIRAGMFDLEMQNNQWTERREFLFTDKTVNSRASLSTQILRRIEQIIPADVPFAHLRALDGDSNRAAVLVRDTLFEGRPEKSKKERYWNWRRYDDADFEVRSNDEDYYGYSCYSYLSHRYNLSIDDPDDAEESGEGEVDDSEIRLAGERRVAGSLRSALKPAQPLSAAKIARPRAIDGPLFADFSRAAIITVKSPASLDRQMLERAIGELAAGRLSIAGASSRFEWSESAQWREMQLPMLGRSVGYGVRGSELIISNNIELLAELMSEKQSRSNREVRTSSPIDELTVIRLSLCREAFDQIFAKLDEPRVKAYWKTRHGDTVPASGSKPSMEFFSGEIASLLDVSSPVDEIRIQRSFVAGRLREEVVLLMK